MKYNIGIRECRKCDNNIRCEECVFPAMANGRAEELVELRKNCWIAEQTIKEQNELIKKLKEDINNFSKANKAVENETIRMNVSFSKARARLLYLEEEPVDNNLYINIRDIESFLKEQEGEYNVKMY